MLGEGVDLGCAPGLRGRVAFDCQDLHAWLLMEKCYRWGSANDDDGEPGDKSEKYNRVPLEVEI